MDIKVIPPTANGLGATAPAERPAVLSMGLALGAGAIVALLCSVAWGVVCYITDASYFWLAIVIGFLISLSVSAFFKRIDLKTALILAVPCVIFAVISVALGDFIYYVLYFMREYSISANEAISGVMESYIELETTSSGLISLGIGGVGAVVGFYRAIMQK